MLQDAQKKLTIYDSLKGEKHLFKPIKEGKVGMYVCGMTVYDYCHIGHARVMVAFDVIVRWMRQLGFDVNYVRNITDIDDKIINRANENGESIEALTSRFIKAMHKDAQSLGCVQPSLEPKATEHIKEMQILIRDLMDKGHAYSTGSANARGDVFYAVDSFKEYGKLSKRNLDDMQAGQRVEVDDNKHNPFDFVLWKSAKPEEPHWQSPWGNGRPGWHIECSAMSQKCLGNTFDIHGGGHDLQFPHHENEIAQSEAHTGCTYANNWMHVGFINVDGEKMSKSLGNFFTIRDVIAKFHPEAVRYFILSSHYRSQVNFSDVALTEAHSALSRLYQALKSAEQYLGNDVELMEAEQAFATNYGLAVIKAMNDDFNVVQALSSLFLLAKEVNIAIKADDKAQVSQLASVLKTLAQPLNILQRNPADFLQSRVGKQVDDISSDDIEALIAERKQAKTDKNFARADEIRANLLEQGIELEDSRNGTTWRRK
ncbi:MAG: cysteine--tRNA ligase [Gammaproteobacteria bacterium]|nr:MAG: cysteine--tRNA ligase [Gammaproteobacteria bacterium]